MGCLQKNPATRRYLQRFISTMVAYVVVLLFVEWFVHRFHPTGALLYGLATLPAFRSSESSSWSGCTWSRRRTSFSATC